MGSLAVAVTFGIFVACAAGTAVAQTGLGHGVVAVVAGQPVSKKLVAHWMRISGKENAYGTGSPALVPTSPPRFPVCVKRAGSKVPRLRGPHHHHGREVYCWRVFRMYSQQVVSFLIRDVWYRDLARARHIRITQARVLRAFHRARDQQFRTRKAFRTFLRVTGQTVKDILFRFRDYLTWNALLGPSHHGNGGDKAFARLNAEVIKRYRPVTHCARYYIVQECANYPRH